MDENISRRDAIKVITGTLGGLTFAIAMGGLIPSFGDGDSEGHSGDHGNSNSGTDTGEGGHGHTFVWFDRGGFTGTGVEPKQGWDRASATYFVDTVMLNHMRNKVKAKNSAGGLPTQIRTNWTRHWVLDGQEMNDRQYYFAVAEDALEKCRNRARKRAQKLGTTYSNKARVVGVGWTWQTDNSAQTWWQFTGLKYTFSELIERAGRTDELYTSTVASEDYWRKNVDDPDYPKMNWRKFVYQRAKDGLTGKYSLIVIAIADSEPGETKGDLKVIKEVQSPDDYDKNHSFTFKVTFTGKDKPADKTFTLKHNQSDTTKDILAGVTATVNETADRLYETIWSPSSRKVTISDYGITEVRAVNKRITGSLKVVKKVKDGTAADKSRKFDFTVTIKRPDNSVYKTIAFKLSEADGEYVIDNIPSEYTFEVKETTPPEYDVEIKPETGKIPAKGTAICTVTNVPHGYLQLTKDVTE